YCNNTIIFPFYVPCSYIGKKIIRITRKIKYGIKQLFIPNMFFEDLGFRYLGPIDGNNIEKVQNILEIAKKVKGPVLVHIVTKKGKGYKIAEENPDKFHSTSSFDIETGKCKNCLIPYLIFLVILIIFLPIYGTLFKLLFKY
ncbi:MAG TPA: hypothetical protein DCZ30_02985, partial [Clostridiales bacterium]|nr:hypothetical protein [Clostridiales bacterium]